MEQKFQKPKYLTANFVVEIIVGAETEKAIIRDTRGNILEMDCTPQDVAVFLSEVIDKLKES